MTHKRRYKKGDSMIYLNDPSLEGTQNIPIDNKDVMDCLADADHVYDGKMGATITWPAFKRGNPTAKKPHGTGCSVAAVAAYVAAHSE